jgi:hypothetical protein
MSTLRTLPCARRDICGNFAGGRTWPRRVNHPCWRRRIRARQSSCERALGRHVLAHPGQGCCPVRGNRRRQALQAAAAASGGRHHPHGAACQRMSRSAAACARHGGSGRPIGPGADKRKRGGMGARITTDAPWCSCHAPQGIRRALLPHRPLPPAAGHPAARADRWEPRPRDHRAAPACGKPCGSSSAPRGRRPGVTQRRPQGCCLGAFRRRRTAPWKHERSRMGCLNRPAALPGAAPAPARPGAKARCAHADSALRSRRIEWKNSKDLRRLVTGRDGAMPAFSRGCASRI